MRTVGELVASTAGLPAGAELLVTPEGRLTYAEAERRSRALGRCMMGAGVGKGSRVGILLPNGLEWAVSWLAAARIGALTLPLSTYLEAGELARTLRNGDVQFLVGVPSLLGRDHLERLERAIPGLAGAARGRPLHLPAVPSLRAVWMVEPTDRPWATVLDDLEPGPDDELFDALEAAVSPADPLAVVHTSGSTAAPKGVVHTNAGLVRHAGRVVRHAHELRSDDRVYSPNPFFWVGGLVHVLLGVMHAGATALVEASFDAERTLRFVRRERMTVFLGQPHARAALLDAAHRLGEPLDGVRMLEHPRSLGMTETAGSHVARPRLGSDSFGTPLAGIEHRIADPQTGVPLPDGTPGEIWVRGEDVCDGLLHHERREAFDADGWYHTGDWGWFDDDGELHFTGRRTEMIKTRGMNVAPREVELALETLPWVSRASVVGLPDAEHGQIVGALLARTPGAQAPSDVAAALKGLISSYKIPRRIQVVGAEDVPLLASGKPDRAAVALLLRGDTP
jgi:acyl-CoA synthetase (AMP-forming)/AMP-acid ligase II